MAQYPVTAAYATIIGVQQAEKEVEHALEVRRMSLVSDYAPSLKEVLGHEGGYTNEATDPGGPTNWGITIFDARMYWKQDANAADVKAMPLSVAKTIYKQKYWDKVRGDALPAGIDYCVFDYGVNSGVVRAVKLLQTLLGVPVDGVMGQWTLDALAAKIRSKDTLVTLINLYQDKRLAFLQGLHHWPTYKNGWSRRVVEVRVLARNMATANVSDPNAYPLPPVQKPLPPVPTKPPGGLPPEVPTKPPGWLDALSALFRLFLGKK